MRRQDPRVVAPVPAFDLQPLRRVACLVLADHTAAVDIGNQQSISALVQDICRVSLMVGLSPIVRVADLQYSLIARSLDCGAQGIIFPRVESPELLERAVSWTKFPPLGVRGYGLTPLQIDHEKASFAEVIAHMNEHTLVVLQIETVKAFERREELLAIPGIDAVMVGPADLSISLGVPGDFDHPKMVETITAIIESCAGNELIC